MARTEYRAEGGFIANPNGASLEGNVALCGEEGYVATTAVNTADRVRGAGNNDVGGKVDTCAG